MSDGRLSDEELKAIRERLSRKIVYDYYPALPDLTDARALLAHADALAADLAAAEGERDGLRLLVTDLVHPEGDGREAQARCYRRGVEDGRAVCVGTVRTALAAQETPPSERAEVRYAAGVLRSLLAALEGPPAPAAAPG